MCLSCITDDAQVTCMWSKRGKEYSGRIGKTCDGRKCVPWARSIHKLRKLPNMSTTHGGILNKFPDRSLADAVNYCRNPSNDALGPWCYTSLVDDRRET